MNKKTPTQPHLPFAPRAVAAAALTAGCFATIDASAATQVLNDVNIINEKEKHAIILLTNNDPETFPYDQAYGLTNYWTKWDVLLNDDDTYSFRLNGKYLSANATGGIDVATAIGTEEKFFLEAGNGSYYMRTWRNTYVGASGSGWKDLVQSHERTSNEEWLFYLRPDPSAGLDDINISNYGNKNIIILLTNNDPETFPYDQAYGAANYWTKWDVIANSDGTVSFRVNGKYLSNDGTDDVQVITSITSASKFTLEAGERGTYAIRANDGRYMAASGTGWKDVILTDTPSDDSLWHFLDRQTVTTFADPKTFMDAATVSNVDEAMGAASLLSGFEAAPALLCAMQTFNGSDPAAVRLDNATAAGFDIQIQEEQSNDSEVAHNNETVGFLAFAEGAIRNTNGAVIGEAGIIDVTQSSASTWFEMTDFIGSYTDPVVIMMMNSKHGSHAGHIRIKGVTTTDFDYQLEEWDYLDGTHTTEQVAYLIVEKGTHTLEKGGTLMAQTQNIDHDWETVTFPATFSAAPIVLSQSQTRKGNAAIVTRQRSVSASSVSIRLQEEEAANGTHDNETVAIVSFGQ